MLSVSRSNSPTKSSSQMGYKFIHDINIGLCVCSPERCRVINTERRQFVGVFFFLGSYRKKPHEDGTWGRSDSGGK